jgi:hypothetical protein
LIAVIGIVLLAAIVFVPQFWVRSIIAHHGKDRPDFPGTGGELARHLLDELDLGHVKVETTELGDHYDSEAKAVRLLPAHHDGRSVSAVAIAAHEVSHALQDGRGEKMLALRHRLAVLAITTDKIASVILIGAPILAAVFRTPAAFLACLGLGVGMLAIRAVVHLVTLPVEFDASFGKALPILQRGRYLSDKDMPAARHVLRAAAFTYLAGALISLFNLARWIRVLR